MKLNQFTMLLLGTALVFGMSAGKAQAISQTYSIMAKLGGGGSLGGTIDIDNNPTVKNQYVTGYNITTSGGTDPRGGGIASFTYLSGSNSTIWFQTNSFTGITGTGGRSLFLGGFIGSGVWTPTLNNPSSTYVVNARERYRYTFTSRGRTRTRSATRSGGAVAGANVSTPEPDSLLLFGSGLAGLGYWRYRKNRKANA